MISLLGFLNGVNTSVMNACNAGLAALWGNYTATVAIHLAGLCLILPLAIGQARLKPGAPWWSYCGGFIGVALVVCSAVGTNALGVTLSLVISLLSQSLVSLIIDHFGWFGAKKSAIGPRQLLSLALMAAGAGVMLLC